MLQKRQRQDEQSAQKVSILSEHLFDKKSTSEVCEAHELQPSVLYEWQRQAQANLAQAQESKRDDGSARERAMADKLAVLETGLEKKDGALAESTEEYVRLKSAAQVDGGVETARSRPMRSDLVTGCVAPPLRSVSALTAVRKAHLIARCVLEPLSP